jgi:hypothetical protein
MLMIYKPDINHVIESMSVIDSDSHFRIHALASDDQHQISRFKQKIASFIEC